MMTNPAVSAAVNHLRIVGDTTRLRIIEAINIGDNVNVTSICGAVGMTQPAVSHHLAILRISGILESSRSGKNVFYSLTDIGRKAWTYICSISHEEPSDPAE